jgi:hypothetical protein
MDRKRVKLKLTLVAICKKVLQGFFDGAKSQVIPRNIRFGE